MTYLYIQRQSVTQKWTTCMEQISFSFANLTSKGPSMVAAMAHAMMSRCHHSGASRCASSCNLLRHRGVAAT